MATLSTNTTTGSIERAAQGFYVLAHRAYGPSVAVGSKQYESTPHGPSGRALTVKRVVWSPDEDAFRLYGTVANV